MSDDRVGKFRDKLNRDRKPYARPKGKIRRVIDSVSGILGGSWVPGFLKSETEQNEEEVPASNTQDAIKDVKPGPSGYIPNRIFYPEEDASCEDDLSLSKIVPETTAQTSSAVSSQRAQSISASAAYTSSFVDSLHNARSSSTNATSSSRHTAVIEQSSVQQQASEHTPVVSTERSTRRYMHSEQTADISTTEGGTKRPLEISPTGHNASLTSSFLAQSNSKRPRFSLSAYSAMANSSMQSPLSESSFRSSPYYPGKTTYGGAAAYRRPATPVQRVVQPSARSSPGGLSDAAQRILSCLNSLSTPLTEAKRVPPPATHASPYSSYLDSPYTAAYHRHKPPAAPLHTPVKARVSRVAQSQSAAEDTPAPVSSVQESVATLPLPEPAVQTPSIFSVAAASSSKTSSSSLLSKSSANTKSLLQSAPSVSTEKPFSFGGRVPMPEPSVGSRKAPCDTVGKKSIQCNRPEPSQSDLKQGGGGGKIGRGKKYANVENEELVVPDLPRATLPKFAFSTPISLPMSRPESKTAEVFSPGLSESVVAPTECMFQFSAPKVLENKHVKVSGQSSLFEFSKPCSVGSTSKESGNKNIEEIPKRLESNKSSSVLNTNSEDLLSFLKQDKKQYTKSNDKPDKTASLTNKSSSQSDGGRLNIDTPSTSGFASQSAAETSKPSISSNSSNSAPMSGFGDRFKKAAGAWECDACMVQNKADASKCVACETAKPGAASSKPSLPSNTFPSTFGSGFGDKFKKSAGAWDCDTCMVQNKADATKCVACESAKPGSAPSKPSLPSTKFPSSSGTGFGDFFKKSAGEWECSSCMLRNSASENKCVACTAAKPGSKSTEKPSEFKFGISSADTSKSSSGGFTFGAPSQSSSEKSSFTFGAPTPAASTKTVPDKTATDSAAKSFGATGEAAKEASKELPSSSFKFGVCETPSESKSKPLQGFGDKFKKAAGDWECKVCLVNNKASDAKCLSCEAIREGAVDKSKLVTGNFQFGAKTSSSDGKSTGFSFGTSNSSASASSGFSFGAQPKDTSKTLAQETSSSGFFSFNPAVSAGSGCLGASDSSSVSGSKSSDGSVTKSTFSFGSAAAAASSSSGFCFGSSSKTTESSDKSATTNSTSSFSFGSSTDKKPAETAPAALFNFGSNAASKEAPSINTNASSDSTSKTTTSAFTFGNSNTNKTANGSNSAGQTAPTFSFGNPNSSETQSKEKSAASPFAFGSLKPSESSTSASNNSNKDSSTPAAFSFGGAKSTEITENPITKLFSKNNGDISESKSHLNNGVAVAPSNGTNVFGTASSNSSFTFGKPTTNGGSAVPVFGGASVNNNNNNIEPPKTFAFGQPAEKKTAAATFNFGQSASAGFGSPAPTPSFNFGQAAAPAANGGAGLFQFGDAAAAPASPAVPAFGSPAANVFSQSTPSGRVIKRGVRRNRK